MVFETVIVTDGASVLFEIVPKVVFETVSIMVCKSADNGVWDNVYDGVRQCPCLVRDNVYDYIL